MNKERSFERAHLNPEELNGLFQRFFKNAPSDLTPEILSGGAANSSYLFRFKGKAYVLKIYSRDKETRGVEKNIHRLIEGKVLVPRFIDSSNDAKHPCSLFEYVEGEPLDHISSLSAEKLSSSLGTLLAVLHSHRFKEAGLFNENLGIKILFPQGSSPYFAEAHRALSLSQRVRSRLGEELADRMLIVMERHRSFFPVIGNSPSLVHSDFKPCNLLFTKSEQIIALDFEFAHAGDPLIDFAILLRHKELIPLDLKTLESSYREGGGVLPDKWPEKAELTDLVNIATMLESPLERPNLLRLFKMKINNTINSLNRADSC